MRHSSVRGRTGGGGPVERGEGGRIARLRSLPQGEEPRHGEVPPGPGRLLPFRFRAVRGQGGGRTGLTAGLHGLRGPGPTSSPTSDPASAFYVAER